MKLNNIIAQRKNKTIYRDGDDVIKVFNNDYLKTDVLNEALNQARVEQTGLNVPTIKAVTMVDGKWAIVTNFIEGKTLDKLIKENPEKTDEYLELFVKLQISIQSKTCPMLSKLKDKMNQKILHADLDQTTKYDLHTRLEGMPKHNKLCHGDFNLTNVIITPDGTPYILDWAHATQGNASADVARTYLILCLNKEEELANKYLQLFCRLTNTNVKYVQKWMPIVAASQSVKGNAEEREFLLSWVNVVDYE